MTSVLNVDTIADKAGTGPVALTKQHAAKGWLHANGGSTTIDDSFNASSLTDTATGRPQMNFTNSFANASYSITATGKARCQVGSQTISAGSILLRYTNTSDADEDRDDNSITCHGDLA